MADDGSPAPRYVIETEAQAIASGAFWWWSPACWPGWQPEKDAANERRVLAHGVISLRAAQDLHRKGCV